MLDWLCQAALGDWFPLSKYGDLRSTDLEARSHPALSQIGGPASIIIL
jgi:hypothetical protein